MDRSVLSEKGIHTSNGSIVYANKVKLQIGERATLTPTLSGKAYGVLEDVNNEALERLYAEPSLQDCQAEDIVVSTLAGESLNAVIYNLPADKLQGSNKTYAKNLAQAATKIGLPQEYIDEILSWAE